MLGVQGHGMTLNGTSWYPASPFLTDSDPRPSCMLFVSQKAAFHDVVMSCDHLIAWKLSGPDTTAWLQRR